MTNRKEYVAELRNKLPYGSVQKIRTRLLDRDIRFSLQYVSRCMNPVHHDYNPIIIEEAIRLVEEDAVRISEMRKRIDLLNDPIL
ncbi:MAG: hypothetical protein WCP39_07895 [Chlamydiota bacterium]